MEQDPIEKEIKRRMIDRLERYADADEGASCEAGGMSIDDLKRETDEIRNKGITL